MPRVNTEIESQTSRSTYGDLTNLNNIKVDYDGTNYTFQVINKKALIAGLTNLKTELKKQISNKDSIIDTITLETLKTELEKETNESRDLGTIGRLNTTLADGKKKISLQLAINYLLNNNSNSLKTAIAQAKTDSIDFTNGTLTQASFDNEGSFVDNLNSKTVVELTIIKNDLEGIAVKIAEAIKIKTDSIATYGDLTSGTIEVDYGTDYTFQINDKTVITGLADLNIELNNQGDTEDDYTIDTLNLTFDETKTVAKAKSIKRYGDLINRKLKISYVRNNFVFQIDEKEQIVGFDNLKSEYKLQKGETNDWTYEEFNTIFNETKFKEGQLAKANSDAKYTKSIDTYGDLTNLTDGTLGVSYVGTNFVFQIDTKDPITGIATFKTQYDLQSGTENTLTTIDEIKTKIGVTKFKANKLAKAISIKTYGDLLNGTIKVDYNRTNYTFKVGSKKIIVGLTDLNTELNNQNDTDTEISYTLNFISSNLSFDQTKSLDKAKKTKNKMISTSRYGDLLNNKIKVDYDGTNYTFQVGENSLITGLAELNIHLNFQDDATTTDYTIDNLPSSLKIDETKTISRAKSIKTYGNLMTQTISVSYDKTIKYTVKGDQKIEFNQLKTEASKQGITLTDEDALINGSILGGLVTLELTKAKAIKTYGDLTNEIIEVDYDGANYTFQINEKELITSLEDLNIALNLQSDTEENYTIDNLSSSLKIDETKTVAKAKAKAKANLTTDINTLLTSELKTAIKKIINANAFDTSSLNENFAVGNFNATTGDFEANFLSGKTSTQLTSIKTNLKNLNANTLTTHAEEKTEATAKSDLTTEINGLLTSELKTAIKKVINANAFDTSSLNENFAVGNFNATTGDFEANFLSGKTSTQLTPIKTNLENLNANTLTTHAEEKTEATAKSDLTTEINGLLTSELKTAIKKVINANAFDTSSLNENFAVGNFNATTGDFEANFLSGKTSTQLTSIKTNLKNLNANTLTTHAEEKTEATAKSDLTTEINGLLTSELKTAIKKVINANAFDTSSLNENFAVGNFNATTGDFEANFLSGKTSTQLTAIKTNLENLNANTLTTHAEEKTEATAKSDLTTEINGLLTSELKTAIKKVINANAFDTSSLNENFAVGNFNATTGDFEANFLSGKTSTQLTPIKTNLENLNANTLTTHAEEKTEATAKSDLTTEINGLLTSELKTAIKKVINANAFDTSSLNENFAVGNFNATTGDFEANFLSGKSSTQLTPIKTNLENLNANTLTTHAEEKTEATAKSDLTTEINGLLTSELKTAIKKVINANAFDTSSLNENFAVGNFNATTGDFEANFLSGKTSTQLTSIKTNLENLNANTLTTHAEEKTEATAKSDLTTEINGLLTSELKTAIKKVINANAFDTSSLNENFAVGNFNATTGDFEANFLSGKTSTQLTPIKTNLENLNANTLTTHAEEKTEATAKSDLTTEINGLLTSELKTAIKKVINANAFDTSSLNENFAVGNFNATTGDFEANFLSGKTSTQLTPIKTNLENLNANTLTTHAEEKTEATAKSDLTTEINGLLTSELKTAIKKVINANAFDTSSLNENFAVGNFNATTGDFEANFLSGKTSTQLTPIKTNLENLNANTLTTHAEEKTEATAKSDLTTEINGLLTSELKTAIKKVINANAFDTSSLNENFAVGNFNATTGDFEANFLSGKTSTQLTPIKTNLENLNANTLTTHAEEKTEATAKSDLTTEINGLLTSELKTAIKKVINANAFDTSSLNENFAVGNFNATTGDFEANFLSGKTSTQLTPIKTNLENLNANTLTTHAEEKTEATAKSDLTTEINGLLTSELKTAIKKVINANAFDTSSLNENFAVGNFNATTGDFEANFLSGKTSTQLTPIKTNLENLNANTLTTHAEEKTEATAKSDLTTEINGLLTSELKTAIKKVINANAFDTSSLNENFAVGNFNATTGDFEANFLSGKTSTQLTPIKTNLENLNANTLTTHAEEKTEATAKSDLTTEINGLLTSELKTAIKKVINANAFDTSSLNENFAVGNFNATTGDFEANFLSGKTSTQLTPIKTNLENLNANTLTTHAEEKTEATAKSDLTTEINGLLTSELKTAIKKVINANAFDTSSLNENFAVGNFNATTGDFEANFLSGKTSTQLTPIKTNLENLNANTLTTHAEEKTEATAKSDLTTEINGLLTSELKTAIKKVINANAFDTSSLNENFAVGNFNATTGDFEANFLSGKTSTQLTPIKTNLENLNANTLTTHAEEKTEATAKSDLTTEINGLLTSELKTAIKKVINANAFDTSSLNENFAVGNFNATTGDFEANFLSGKTSTQLTPIKTNLENLNANTLTTHAEEKTEATAKSDLTTEINGLLTSELKTAIKKVINANAFDTSSLNENFAVGNFNATTGDFEANFLSGKTSTQLTPIKTNLENLNANTLTTHAEEKTEATAKSDLTTEINGLLTSELKTAIKKVINANAFDTSSLNENFAVGNFNATTGDFEANFLSGKTSTQLTPIKTNLENLNANTLTTHAEEKTEATAKSDLTTEINGLLTSELKTAIKKVINANAFDTSSLNENFAVGNFNATTGDFEANFLSGKTSTQLTPIKTNLENLNANTLTTHAEEKTEATAKSDLTTEINGLLTSELKTAIKKVINANAFDTSSLNENFAVGNFNATTGDFEANFLSGKTSTQLTPIKTNLENLNANTLTTHAEEKTEATAKSDLTTEINGLLTSELKTAIKKVINANAFDTSSLNENFAVGNFNATTGDFEANFLSGKTSTQLTPIKTNLENLNANTLTTHAEEKTEATAKSDLTTEINGLLTSELKTAIKKVINANAFDTSSLNENFAVGNFNATTGDFEANFLSGKTSTQLTPIKTNLENLNANTLTTHAEEKTEATAKSDLTTEINGLLTSELKTAIKKVINANAFDTSSLNENFAVGNFNATTGDFEANFLSGKTSTQLTPIKTNLENLNANTLTTHAEEKTEATAKSDLTTEINGLLTSELKTAIKKVINANAFDTSSLNENFAVGNFNATTGDFEANFLSGKTSTQLTPIKTNLENLNANTLTTHAEEKTEATAKSDLTTEINGLLTSELKTAIKKVINANAFDTSSLNENFAVGNFNATTGDFEANFLSGKTSTQLTPIKTNLENLNANTLTTHAEEKTEATAKSDLTTEINGLLTSELKTAIKKVINANAFDTSSLNENFAVGNFNATTGDFEANFLSGKTSTQLTPIKTNLENLNANTLTTHAEEKTEATAKSDLTTEINGLLTVKLKTAIEQAKADSIAFTSGTLTQASFDGEGSFVDNLNTKTVEQLTDIKNALGTLANKITKAESIETYGNLTDLDEIVVDYVEANYTFKVGSNSLIAGLELFKTELGNQGITTTTINNIDDVVETIQGLTGALNTTNANAKKTTTSTTSEPDQLQGSESNNLFIIPIVSGVIMIIIVIGVLLKKYFKNKKNK